MQRHKQQSIVKSIVSFLYFSGKRNILKRERRRERKREKGEKCKTVHIQNEIIKS